MLSTLYAAVARRRRERYAARPDLRRRLRRPVVSVGNLAVGGRGKTPVTAAVARLLASEGERPAILSRGYGRTEPQGGVVVVSDGSEIHAPLEQAGDEPLMLARQLPGIPVLVAAERFRAGTVAERDLGATVHVLDDGFQHLQLDRDVDVVLVAPEDLKDPRTLPGGRLREPLDTLIAADAVLALDGADVAPPDPSIPVFTVRRLVHAARAADGVLTRQPGGRVLAVAGIASPARFFQDVRRQGWSPTAELSFPDHHPYTPRDVRRIVEAASRGGADLVITTEKDAVRLEAAGPLPLGLAWLPLTMEPEPLPAFRDWLIGAIRSARDLTTLG